MNRTTRIDLFVEDRAHEQFLKPLISRIAKEEGVQVESRVRSARGGHPRAIGEFVVYQNLLETGGAGEEHPVLVIVAIDGNCMTSAKKRTEIQKATKASFAHRLVPACPDPHVERWYLADPDSFHDVVGRRPTVGRKKCERAYYKKILVESIRAAGHPVTLGGIEFAPDLVGAMDLYRAGKNDASLHDFVEALRDKLRQIHV